MRSQICVLPGDGIGKEVTDQAEKVLRALEKRFGHSFELERALIGGAAIDETGGPLPERTLRACRESDAVLMGAVGGPRWDGAPWEKRPEKGLLDIRKELGLFANLRPAVIFRELAGASLLRPDIVEGGIDLLVVRELTGGVYFGEPKGRDEADGSRSAYNTMRYSEQEIARIARVGFESARKRRGRVCSVDKANVLAVSELWREVVREVAKDYPDVELSHMYVDNAAMQLVRDPTQFDVILTSNLFGDILSDEAASITGSIGLLPSASLSGSGFGLYEPVHGSAPDIEGRNQANPMAMLLSLAMMLRYSLGLEGEAKSVEEAVAAVLKQGFRTRDLAHSGETVAGCSEIGDLVAEGV
ncbi:MAG: 3-isopropylmalate dehydrogenase [Desulfohalobiaceae bacterium]|nr:3-isopropylmalate dehydrogenase [Desulfohalobiaceae bacterium]